MEIKTFLELAEASGTQQEYRNQQENCRQGGNCWQVVAVIDDHYHFLWWSSVSNGARAGEGTRLIYPWDLPYDISVHGEDVSRAHKII